MTVWMVTAVVIVALVWLAQLRQLFRQEAIVDRGWRRGRAALARVAGGERGPR